MFALVAISKYFKIAFWHLFETFSISIQSFGQAMLKCKFHFILFYSFPSATDRLLDGTIFQKFKYLFKKNFLVYKTK